MSKFLCVLLAMVMVGCATLPQKKTFRDELIPVTNAFGDVIAQWYQKAHVNKLKQAISERQYEESMEVYNFVAERMILVQSYLKHKGRLENYKCVIADALGEILDMLKLKKFTKLERFRPFVEFYKCDKGGIY